METIRGREGIEAGRFTRPPELLGGEEGWEEDEEEAKGKEGLEDMGCFIGEEGGEIGAFSIIIPLSLIGSRQIGQTSIFNEHLKHIPWCLHGIKRALGALSQHISHFGLALSASNSFLNFF